MGDGEDLKKPLLDQSVWQEAAFENSFGSYNSELKDPTWLNEGYKFNPIEPQEGIRLPGSVSQHLDHRYSFDEGNLLWENAEIEQAMASADGLEGLDADALRVCWEKLRSTSLRPGNYRHMSRCQSEDSSVDVWREGLQIFLCPWKFLQDLGASVSKFVKDSIQTVQSDPKSAFLAVKAGIATVLVSILCVAGSRWGSLSSAGLWALATVDMTFESNAGLALSKGVNRVLGTLAAGFLAVLVNHLGPLTGKLHPYFVLLCVFLSSVVLTFYKYRAPFKDRWNYAVVISLLTFHILIITGYSSQEKIVTPVTRFLMILLGFLVASMVQLGIRPAYAGDALHSLVGKNFTNAAKVLERCVEEYKNGSILPHVPDIYSGRRKGDNTFPSLYLQVIMSDAEVDKHLAAVLFEPCHGRFFYGYPWHLYDDISDNLRYAVYDIIGLDLCLRAEIQAPPNLRQMIEAEMITISSECASALKEMGRSLATFTWVDCQSILHKAEEAALLLQHRLCKHLPHLLGLSVFQAPSLSSTPPPTSSPTTPRKSPKAASTGLGMNGEHCPLQPLDSVPEGNSLKKGRSGLGTGGSASSETEGQAANLALPGVSTLGQEGPVWKKEFLQRQSSIAAHWDGTVARISALSLVKFSSLLLELVAKMQFVVGAVEQLAQEAHFDGAPPPVPADPEGVDAASLLPHASAKAPEGAGAAVPDLKLEVRDG